LSGKIF
jgi:hypothetical protein